MWLGRFEEGSQGAVDHEERWKAVIDCNKEYDGVFYYAVKTTKIFCRPSCKAKAPLRENVRFFDCAEDALKEGFRPCKLCRPDIEDSDFYPNKELIKRVKDAFEQNYSKSFDIDAVANGFGLSKRHLMRLFKTHCGTTPIDYIQSLRIKRAQLLLRNTNKGILEIALEVGFESLSTFYKHFKSQVGVTPKRYREFKI